MGWMTLCDGTLNDYECILSLFPHSPLWLEVTLNKMRSQTPGWLFSAYRSGQVGAGSPSSDNLAAISRPERKCRTYRIDRLTVRLVWFFQSVVAATSTSSLKHAQPKLLRTSPRRFDSQIGNTNRLGEHTSSLHFDSSLNICFIWPTPSFSIAQDMPALGRLTPKKEGEPLYAPACLLTHVYWGPHILAPTPSMYVGTVYSQLGRLTLHRFLVSQRIRRAKDEQPFRIWAWFFCTT